MGDYVLVLLGFALSIYLAGLSGLQPPAPAADAGLFLGVLAGVIPILVLMPLGVVLLWPVFYLIGRMAGRTQGLALGEWLWGFAWLVSLLLTAWIIWKGSGSAPEALTDEDFKQAFFTGYTLYLLAMGAVAFFVWLFCLFSSTLFPWTHSFGLALLFWPIVPVTLILVMKWHLKFL